jgi:lactam utilization protein B
MSRNGLFDDIPTPPVLRAHPLQVEFISMLAQAQKAVATGAIERFWQFGGQISALKPEAADRLDPDGTMEAYAEMTGVPSGVMVDRKQAEAIRQQRAKQQAQQAALQQGLALVQGAKIASEIDVGGGQNAVSAMLGGA